MAEAYRAFGSYLLFKQILSDSLGHLFRAGEFDRGGVSRTVWLRIFDTEQISNENFISDVERAEEFAAVVTSTNVVSGVSCFISDGSPALACDYVASQPLSLVFDRVISEQFPIPVDNALLILEKISLALTAAMTAEIGGERVVHGFVHPGLIFVTNDGEGTVSGFGLGASLLSLADSDAVVEDIHPYLAPEVLRTFTPSQRGDVYSLGAILFHLLSGSSLPPDPQERQTAIDSAQMAYEETAVPEDIQSLLRRCLAENPDERYSSAADFKKELDRLLYGGAYSPTTFNLALFMDRLFRAEIEAEEQEMTRENSVDVSSFLEPVIVPEPEAVSEPEDEDQPGGFNKLWWYAIGGAGAIVAVVAAMWGFGGRASAPPAVPTPTTAEVTAQREAQEEKMRVLAQGLVAEMMAEKEEEIREELTDRQEKIEDLQRRLRESEKRTEQRQPSAVEQQRRDDLQSKIATEEEIQRQRENELAAERQRAEEEVLRQAAAQQTATATAEEQALLSAVPAPTPPPSPTSVPTPPPTAVVEKPEAIAVNTFFEPSEVDSLPVIISKENATWPAIAYRSRVQGVVIIQVTVNADGLVDEAKVLRVDHVKFGIPEAAVEAALKCRFKPAVKDGVRVKSYATITEHYRFLLTAG